MTSSSTPTEATITPRPNADSCEVEGCDRTDRLATVNPDGPTPATILCPDHRVDRLREVSSR